MSSDVGSPKWYEFFNTSSFWEKMVLLGVTALISGLLVPVVVKSIDETRARQATVRAAQERLYTDVSATLLTLQTLALDVSWFGTSGSKDVDNQKRAYQRYNERAVDLVAQWRTQIARAQTLATPAIASELNEMLTRYFISQDTPLVRMWAECATQCNWDEQHKKSEEMLATINDYVRKLANDLQVVRP